MFYVEDENGISIYESSRDPLYIKRENNESLIKSIKENSMNYDEIASNVFSNDLNGYFENTEVYKNIDDALEMNFYIDSNDSDVQYLANKLISKNIMNEKRYDVINQLLEKLKITNIKIVFE